MHGDGNATDCASCPHSKDAARHGHVTTDENGLDHHRMCFAAQLEPVHPVPAVKDTFPCCREQIVEAIRSHQVILLAGETGCGKTTQIPQYILEDSWGERLRLTDHACD